MNNRIGSFISSIITILLSLIALYLCYKFNQTITNVEGIEKISFVVTVPILIFFYIFLFGFCLSGIITSMRAIFSESKVIKILSIILLIIALAVTTLSVMLLVQVI